MAAPTRAIILYRGSGLTPTADYTDATDWPGTELTAMAHSAEAGAGTWLVRDEDGSIPDYKLGRFLNSHNVVIATTGSNTLWRGRIADQSHFRGRQKAARAAEWSLVVEDQNSHLRGIIVNSWARSSETDVARVQALVAAYLSGSPRGSTNLNGSNLVITSSNTVALPAKTYNGVEVADVLSEIQQNADKELFVTVDNELAYFGHDYTGYAASIRISDNPTDANATTFAPIDPKGSIYGRAQTTALRYYWGVDVAQKTTRITAPAATESDYWEEVFWDADSPTDAAAAAKAQKILDVKSQSETTYSCSIGPLSGDDVWRIKVGQTIQFKSRGAMGGRNPAGTFYADSFITVRIREISWSMPAEDTYFARLELEKPRRVFPVSTGDEALTTQPKPVVGGDVPTFVSAADYPIDYVGGGSPVQVTYPLSFQAGDLLIIFVSSPNDRPASAPAGWSTIYNGGATGGSFYRTAAFAKVADATDVSNAALSIFVDVAFTGSVGGVARIGIMSAYRGVASQPVPWENVVAQGIVGSPSSLGDTGVTASGNGRLAVNLLYTANGDVPTLYLGASGGTWIQHYAAGSADPTTAFVGNITVGIYTADLATGGTINGGSYTRGGALEDGQILGFALIGSSGIPPAATDGTGSAGGDKGFYALADHKHPWQTAIPAIDASGDLIYGSADDTPIRLALGGSNTHLTSDGVQPRWMAQPASLTNPMTTAGDIITGAGGGAPARLALGASNTHLISDGVSVLWRPNTGGGGSLTDHDHTAGGDGGDLTGALVSNYMDFTEQGSAPSSPSSGKVRLFGSNLYLYQKDSGGGVTRLSGSGGGGGGSGIPFGSSFPGGPADGDPYFRTDLKVLFVYWNSVSGWVPSSAGRNLLVNGSFENGLTGWSNSGPPTTTTYTSTDAVTSLLFTGSIGYYYAFQVVKLRTGRSYVGSFWLFTGSGPSSSAGAGVQIEGLGSYTGEISRLLTSGFPGSWTQYAFWFTATADDDSVNLVVTNSYGGTSTGDLFFDDIQLREIGPLPMPTILL